MASSSVLRSGIKNYARYLNVLSGTTPYVSPASNTYELLETTILGSSTPTVTFSNLNSTYGATYQHLQFRILMRSTRNDTDSLCYMQFNGDTASNYSTHAVRGSGTETSSISIQASYPSGIVLYSGLAGATNTANSFGANIVDILDPFETSKYTTTRALAGQVGSFNRIALESGSWRNTAALTSITFDDIFGNFVSGSRFSLYGIRSA